MTRPEQSKIKLCVYVTLKFSLAAIAFSFLAILSIFTSICESEKPVTM